MQKYVSKQVSQTADSCKEMSRSYFTTKREEKKHKIQILHVNEANSHYGVKYDPTCFYNLPLKIDTFKK